MEIMKNLFDQSAVNAHSPMMLPTDFQQLRRELMRDWKQAALESLGTMPVDELEQEKSRVKPDKIREKNMERSL